MGRHGTIAGRKSAQDNKRAQIFTKYSRLITVAAKAGGDPDYNFALKNAIEKAKAINMPNDNIIRSIKKGTGELAGEIYEEESFEGYGPGGVAIIVDVLTDNKNRTTSSVRHAFDKCNGNLGTAGCVSYMFSRKGIIDIEKADGIEEDVLMEAALEAGADDFVTEEDYYEIITDPSAFQDVSSALRAAGYELAEAEVEYVPSVEATPSEQDQKNLCKLLEMLEEDDDVQNVYHNCAVELDY